MARVTSVCHRYGRLEGPTFKALRYFHIARVTSVCHRYGRLEGPWEGGRLVDFEVVFDGAVNCCVLGLIKKTSPDAF